MAVVVNSGRLPRLPAGTPQSQQLGRCIQAWQGRLEGAIALNHVHGISDFEASFEVLAKGEWLALDRETFAKAWVVVSLALASIVESVASLPSFTR